MLVGVLRSNGAALFAVKRAEEGPSTQGCAFDVVEQVLWPPHVSTLLSDSHVSQQPLG